MPDKTTPPEPSARERFFELYDDAKRCLHRALDRHNVNALRPVVIKRDGSNFLDAIDALPLQSFGDDPDEGLRLKQWIRGVFEVAAWRQGAGAEPSERTLAELESVGDAQREAIIKHLR